MTSMTSAMTADFAPLAEMELTLADPVAPSTAVAAGRSLQEIVFYGLAFGSAVTSGIVIGFTSVGPWIHQVVSLMA